MGSEMELKERLIDEYYMLEDLKKVAKKSSDEAVIKAIEKQQKRIKLKLHPLELPPEED